MPASIETNGKRCSSHSASRVTSSQIPSFNPKGVEGTQSEAVQGALSQPRLMTKPAPSALLATTKENFHAETSKLQPNLNRAFPAAVEICLLPSAVLPRAGSCQVWYCNPSFLNQPRMLDSEPISMDEWSLQPRDIRIEACWLSTQGTYPAIEIQG